jgi:hypothetical protein
MKTIRAVAAGALFIATIGGVATPAAAQPANDTYAGRVTLSEPLPITVSADTTEATTDADDAELNTCGAPATDASVWFVFTPRTAEDLAVDVTGSDYSAGVIVAVGAPGGWSVQACGGGGVAWSAAAGMTYTLLVVDDQVDGGGNGGTLELVLDVAPPPPTIEVTVAARGTFNPKTGAARISGTYTCTQEGAGDATVFADVQLRQRAGRVIIQGFGVILEESVQCDGTPQPWTQDFDAMNGLFKGGNATAIVAAQACGPFSCGSFFEATQTVKLVSVGGKK